MLYSLLNHHGILYRLLNCVLSLHLTLLCCYVILFIDCCYVILFIELLFCYVILLLIEMLCHLFHLKATNVASSTVHEHTPTNLACKLWLLAHHRHNNNNNNNNNNNSTQSINDLHTAYRVFERHEGKVVKRYIPCTHFTALL